MGFNGHRNGDEHPQRFIGVWSPLWAYFLRWVYAVYTLWSYTILIVSVMRPRCNVRGHVHVLRLFAESGRGEVAGAMLTPVGRPTGGCTHFLIRDSTRVTRAMHYCTPASHNSAHRPAADHNAHAICEVIQKNTTLTIMNDTRQRRGSGAGCSMQTVWNVALLFKFSLRTFWPIACNGACGAQQRQA